MKTYSYGHDLISQTGEDRELFYLYDKHSGIRQTTDSSGIVTDSYAYDAYGNLLESSGDTDNSYLYQGEQFDENLGLQYLRQRYYDSDTGRFISVDPFEGLLENPITRHRYIYGNDNPVNYNDPSGEIALTMEQS